MRQTDIAETDRADRVAELRRLVQSGKYQVDPRDIAAGIIRESEMPGHEQRTAISKTADARE